MEDNIKTIHEDVTKIDFHHPYTPYEIQEQFMRTVYDVLEKGNGRVGILESPTGTVGVFPSSYVASNSKAIAKLMWTGKIFKSYLCLANLAT